MHHLIKLELRKNNIRSYIVAVIIIVVVMQGFLYLFAYAPKLEPGDADMQIFMGYGNLVPLFGVLNMAVFSVLSAVMYSKFIIEAYSGKHPILLFSYPVSRVKVILAKFIVVGMFSFFSMFLTTAFNFTVFSISESILPLMKETITFEVLKLAAKTSLVMAFLSVITGIIAVGIGFIKKSVQVTIVTAVIVASFMCNVVASSAADHSVLLIITIFMMILVLLLSANMIRQVNYMEIV